LTAHAPTICHHVGPAIRSGQAVAVDLANAEACCLRAGERWTPPRRRTYELLAEAGRPVKTYDLIAAFGPARRSAKPPTVYRALEFLESLGLVHRVTGLSAFIACQSAAAAHQAEFLICDCCGHAEEVDLGADQLVQASAQSHGFLVERLFLEIHGLCPACQAGIADPSTC
jgi:Fur family zinc uptake transcriptional regulator